MKNQKKLVSLILSIIMLITTGGSVFASENSTRKVLYINDQVVTEKQLDMYLSEITPDEAMVNTSTGGRVKRSVAGAIAVYSVPGLGQVALLATGAVVVGGVVWEVGTWVGEKFAEWLESNEAQKDYEDAKDNGTKTDNHSEQEGGALDKEGAPLSSKDLYDKNGELKQRRYYDKKGNADMDIDYKHGGVGHTFPHRHDWNRGQRGDAY